MIISLPIMSGGHAGACKQLLISSVAGISELATWLQLYERLPR
jgi:hypothetical protein